MQRLLEFDRDTDWLAGEAAFREHVLLFALRGTGAEARMCLGSFPASKHAGAGLGRDFILQFHALVIAGEVCDSRGNTNRAAIDAYQRTVAQRQGMDPTGPTQWRDLHMALEDCDVSARARDLPPLADRVAQGVAHLQAQQLEGQTPFPTSGSPRPRI